MLLDSLGDMADIARGVFPISYILVVPLLILIVPINPVNATHDFSVYRMNQFDLQGTSYGRYSKLLFNYIGLMLLLYIQLISHRFNWLHI